MWFLNDRYCLFFQIVSSSCAFVTTMAKVKSVLQNLQRCRRGLKLTSRNCPQDSKRAFLEREVEITSHPSLTTMRVLK